MFFIFITTLLFLASSVNGLTPEFGLHEYFLDNVFYSISELNLCPGLLVEEFSGKRWIDIVPEKQHELFYCLSTKEWPDSKESDCDILMTSGTIWSEMDAVEKRFATDCALERYITNAFKGLDTHSSALLVVSYLVDRDSEKIFQERLFNCSLVRKQFEEDQMLDYEKFISGEMKRIWSFLGLNISHYQRESIVDEESLTLFQQKATLKDYFLWNGLKNCESIDEKRIEFMPIMGTFIRAVKREKPDWLSSTPFSS